ncbi:50S ribosomal protein L2 [Candidatus Dojkabacteria bacterium]|nr:50S ribosomal protein L2 [Candidatus Dojkabacteria bacterium]
MAIKSYNPKTSTLRHTHLEDRSNLSKKKPEKKLVRGKIAGSGRNRLGRVTVRHRGGGVKRKLRLIDHKKNKFDIPGIVEALEYDPNISANIALIKYADGERRYVLAARNLEVGNNVITSENAMPEVGNTLKLKNIPSGTPVFDVEIVPGKGGQFGRSAGVIIVAQGEDSTGKYMQLKMPSGEIRLVPIESYATVGQVGNEDHMNVKLGKAGRKRRMGFRPSVRGTAMHAEQHPHGAGEGRTGVGGGYHGSKDIWGNRIGVKTRKNKSTGKYIIKRKTTRRRPETKSTY